MDPQAVLEDICLEWDITIDEVLSHGDVCKMVYRATDDQGRKVVLKVGADERTRQEIARNIAGYEAIEKLGLSWFIPQIYVDGMNDPYGYSWITMEDCGDDFLTAIRNCPTPINFYYGLVDQIRRVYCESIEQSLEAKRMLVRVTDKTMEQYLKYIEPNFDQRGELRPALERLRQDILSEGYKYACFSNWDFTPEDVYLADERIKYTDPHEQVMGIPIVDLACFAGVARDAYHLPFSNSGYDIIRDFVMTELITILEIPRLTALKIFRLGRILQCFLSARFRLNSDLQEAKQHFARAQIQLEKTGV